MCFDCIVVLRDKSELKFMKYYLSDKNTELGVYEIGYL